MKCGNIKQHKGNDIETGRIKLCNYPAYYKVHAFERFFFSNFYFYGSFNAEFREDFRHVNNSSVTSKSPLLPKFKNMYLTFVLYSASLTYSSLNVEKDL